jgi:hypothetical protein
MMHGRTLRGCFGQVMVARDLAKQNVLALLLTMEMPHTIVLVLLDIPRLHQFAAQVIHGNNSLA